MSSRNWAFTWNNYDESVEEKLRSLKCKYLVAGREICPTTGTPHLQCTVVFTSAKTKSAVIKILKGAHVAPCRNVFDSIEYCKKDEDALGYFEVGNPPMNQEEKGAAGVRATSERNRLLATGDLNVLCDAGEFAFSQLAVLKRCQQIYLAALKPYYHNSVRGIWLYGPPGTGKTRYAHETYPGLYIKAQNKWFDGYTGQETILLDDLDTDTLGHYLKIWMDRYAFTGETKNGHVQMQHHRFIVTSNYSIEELIKDPIMAQAIRRRVEIRYFPSCVFNPLIPHVD